VITESEVLSRRLCSNDVNKYRPCRIAKFFLKYSSLRIPDPLYSVHNYKSILSTFMPVDHTVLMCLKVMKWQPVYSTHMNCRAINVNCTHCTLEFPPALHIHIISVSPLVLGSHSSHLVMHLVQHCLVFLWLQAPMLL